MMKKILDLNIRNTFFYIFSIYFLLGMHISLDHVGGHGLYLPFNIIGWIFVSLLIGIGLYQISCSEKLFITKLQIYFLIGSTLLVVPFFYPNNVHASLALMRIMGLFGGLLLYLSFSQFQFSKEEKNKFLYVILGSVLIQILLKYSSFIQPQFSAMAQKNIFASFLSTGAALSLFLVVKENYIINNSLNRILVFCIPFFTSLQIYNLQSRTGYLSLIAGIIFLIFYRNLRNKILFFWFGLLLTGLLIGALTINNTRPTKEIEYSENTRIVTYQLTYEMIKNNPIFGTGYGNFLSAFRHHYAKRKSDDQSLQTIGNSNMDHPHNELLFWTVEGGILPLVGLLIMAGSFLNMIWTVKQKKAWAILGILLPILIHTQLELPFYISLVHWIIFIFIIYLIDSEYGNHFETKVSFSSIFRFLSFVIPFVITVYMGTTLKTASVITQFERTGYKDPSLLVSIVNPYSWQKKYETLIMKLNLNIAKKTKNTEKLNDYIEWAERYVDHSPYLFIYYDLATAYEALGDGEKAWEVYRYAQYLYPGAKWRDEN